MDQLYFHILRKIPYFLISVLIYMSNHEQSLKQGFLLSYFSSNSIQHLGPTMSFWAFFQFFRLNNPDDVIITKKYDFILESFWKIPWVFKKKSSILRGFSAGLSFFQNTEKPASEAEMVTFG